MMYLPKPVAFCVDRLESAGFAAYAVGGCVRDFLLGLTPHDYDLCTAAAPKQIEAVFSDCRLLLTGEKHGTVTVLTGGTAVEITTFRTEGSYRDNRRPDHVTFVTDIREDLRRRDFTVNAMAYSPRRGFVDPWDGQADLKNRILRAVGLPDARFREDALRILRGMRFSVRYGLRLHEETWRAMRTQSHLLGNLAAERVFSELCQLIPLVSADDLLFFAPILGIVLPELEPTFGFDQRSPHHAFDLYTHIAHVTAAVPPELPLRFAALLHDVGKVPAFTQDENGRGHFYGHAGLSAEMADSALLRLKAPTALRQRVVALIRLHMNPLTPDRRLLRRYAGKYGMEFLWQLYQLQKADFTGKGVSGGTYDFQEIARLLTRIQEENACLTVKELAVDGNDLIALGFSPGKALGQCLSTLLQLVLDERLPNEKEILLQTASRLMTE